MPRESMGRRMVSREEQDIQFYRGSAVHEFLKKLNLSTEEKRYIQAVIKTAKVS